MVEYWVDVRPSGSLSTSHREEFTQSVEIIDDGTSLPAPTLGKEAMPSYDDLGEEDEDDEDDDDGVDDTRTPSTRRKKRRGKKTPSPKSKMLAKQKKEREEKEAAVETALEVTCLHFVKPDDPVLARTDTYNIVNPFYIYIYTHMY